MAIQKRSDLRSEVASCNTASRMNQSRAFTTLSNRPLRSNISAESPDFAATLFSKSLNVARRELNGVTGSFAIFFTKGSDPRNGRSVSRTPLRPIIHFGSVADNRFITVENF